MEPRKLSTKKGFRVRMNWKLSAIALTLTLALMPLGAFAQMPQSVAAGVQATAKVTAIDYKTRVATLQDAQGNSYQVQAPPEIKRFNDIKVGDTITFTYQESVALAVVKPGAAMPEAQSSPTVTRGTGSKPSGTISQTQSTTVTIQSIDMNKPEITVKTQDGRVLSMKVQDKNNLTGLKPGDVVQITYTEAIMMSVQ